MYKIEKNIKPQRNYFEFAANIPWPSMAPGDCVVIPVKDMAEHNTQSCRNAMYDIALQNGCRIKTELTDKCLKIWKK